MTRLLIISTCAALVGVTPWLNRSNSVALQEGDPPQLKRQDPDSVSRRDFMRTKLMYTQHVFEGLTINDFELIEEAIAEIELITEGEKWVAINDPEYQRLTEEFQLATERLKRAAKTENIEATALRYYNLSTSCIDCHQYIRNAGFEL